MIGQLRAERQLPDPWEAARCHSEVERAALRAHWLDVAIVVLTIPLLGKALAWIR